jgi:hypothetical protein
MRTGFDYNFNFLTAVHVKVPIFSVSKQGHSKLKSKQKSKFLNRKGLPSFPSTPPPTGLVLQAHKSQTPPLKLRYKQEELSANSVQFS